jgi:hypothetical protein
MWAFPILFVSTSDIWCDYTEPVTQFSTVILKYFKECSSVSLVHADNCVCYVKNNFIAFRFLKLRYIILEAQFFFS